VNLISQYFKSVAKQLGNAGNFLIVIIIAFTTNETVLFFNKFSLIYSFRTKT